MDRCLYRYQWCMLSNNEQTCDILRLTDGHPHINPYEDESGPWYRTMSQKSPMTAMDVMGQLRQKCLVTSLKWGYVVLGIVLTSISYYKLDYWGFWSWFFFVNSYLTMVMTTIKPTLIVVVFTNLAIKRGLHSSPFVVVSLPTSSRQSWKLQPGRCRHLPGAMSRVSRHGRWVDVYTMSAWWFGEHFWHFPINIGNVIIPIDEVIFFRGVAQPPTRCYTPKKLNMIELSNDGR